MGIRRVDNFGDFMESMADLEQASVNKRLDVANVSDYIKWVSEILREHQIKYSQMHKKYLSIMQSFSDATVGLRRLGTVVKLPMQGDLDHIVELHANQLHINQGVVFELEKCQTIVKDTTDAAQLIGETLKSKLADRHKKVAMQKELGLRLKDLQDAFTRCQQSINQQEKLQTQLSQAVQDLLHKSQVKLPPSVKRDHNREDEVNKLALKYKKHLETKEPELSGFGNEPAAAKSGDVLKCAVALATGVALGFALLRNRL